MEPSLFTINCDAHFVAAALPRINDRSRAAIHFGVMQHDVLLIAGSLFAVVEVGTIVFRDIQLRAQLACRRLGFPGRNGGLFTTLRIPIRRNARIIYLELRMVGLLLRRCATRQRTCQRSSGKYPYQSHTLSFQLNGAPSSASLSRTPNAAASAPSSGNNPRCERGECHVLQQQPKRKSQRAWPAALSATIPGSQHVNAK